MLTVFIGGAIVRAYVISKLWKWFVAPTIGQFPSVHRDPLLMSESF
jgi:hypothetical protein